MTDIQSLYRDYQQALTVRANWESTWQECYAYALPQRETVFSASSSKISTLFDATAPDATDQLAALMLSELTPPWMRWFSLSAGTEFSSGEKEECAPTLEKISATLQNHFDRSNFATEIHQCYLDLITAGTACLLFEEAPIGASSAFRFTAVPLSELCLSEGPTGKLDKVFRCFSLSRPEFEDRFGAKYLNEDKEDETPFQVIEAILPQINGGYRYVAFIDPNCQHVAAKNQDFPFVLKEATYTTSPFIAFRWLKAPGEVYGRSPVMKALPDIKTANKVVELILKNATIAVTGIWLAEDDGILNPANIHLTPGAIIPKAVGSKGLTPLEAPGKFDVSQLVIKDLREHIRHALLGDKLGTVCDDMKMTATEVLERSDEMIRILGATYGRLQSELLMPLIERATALLRKRGEIPEIFIDGRLLNVSYKSPRAETQNRKDAQNALQWLTSVASLGQEANSALNVPEIMKWLAEKLGLPANFMVEKTVVPEIPLKESV